MERRSIMNQCRGEYGYAFILVLFILLAIIGACWGF
ncbi:MAG: YjcZ family sporulation protein [Bacilli bacterium]